MGACQWDSPPTNSPKLWKKAFKFTVKTGKLVRQGKGGVDWYRYQKEVLLAKLFPFVKECLEFRKMELQHIPIFTNKSSTTYTRSTTYFGLAIHQI
ncbi:hypothetical protein CIRG_02894 [Coccidioides immitis RMSCC 2394]|uniref:Uncharacterized protein n=1 Tax=Coccidioides immitis RMSCC 2394 TaxID=404692 RepID=A0A0J7B0A3_COCIT|nr:hypothetical protein CIRG_02894 [Coccidioides immitis RMSCC 2394]